MRQHARGFVHGRDVIRLVQNFQPHIIVDAHLLLLLIPSSASFQNGLGLEQKRVRLAVSRRARHRARRERKTHRVRRAPGVILHEPHQRLTRFPIFQTIIRRHARVEQRARDASRARELGARLSRRRLGRRHRRRRLREPRALGDDARDARNVDGAPRERARDVRVEFFVVVAIERGRAQRVDEDVFVRRRARRASSREAGRMTRARRDARADARRRARRRAEHREMTTKA